MDEWANVYWRKDEWICFFMHRKLLRYRIKWKNLDISVIGVYIFIDEKFAYMHFFLYFCTEFRAH